MPLAGVPHGHPMAMGHPSNQGGPAGGQPPGAVMGQQMHPGLSGPGGPQVSQAGPMMANIPLGAGGPGPGGPGAGGPSAHALSHLNPGQAQQIFAQQQQQQHQQAQMAQAREWKLLSSVVSFLHISTPVQPVNDATASRSFGILRGDCEQCRHFGRFMMLSCPACVEVYCGRMPVAFPVQWVSTEHGLLCPLFSG